ncbi:UDP-N-acetylglucosamine 4,6-dehydratase [plant metagenome]
MMRPVNIEDLLGRESVRIDNQDIQQMLTSKRILVTGAGGSIGSELCRQLAKFSPSRLILVETSEFALYTIEQWFTENRPEIAIVPLAGDVKDATRMDEIFSTWSPSVVFHAAAYKHVPLMEVGNAWQAVRNNVLGTLNVAQAAARNQAERFVLISTDKAVNPTNVMGATKRMAEMVCEVLHCQGSGTRFQMVRFGNVLGSTGSVIPKFHTQIARGGPVTVTHPDITRYFMSIPEAAQLVLQAAAMGKGGEVFVLDMGEPVRIADLARNMIRLSGFSEEEILIEYTGLRPGEKLYEELLADSEETLETHHAKLRIARSRPVPEGFFEENQAWLLQPGPVSDEQVRRHLQHWMPEYLPFKG